jgi:HSP20 family protein
MVEVVHKTDSVKSFWYLSDDPQNMTSENCRWRITTRQHGWRPPTDMFETEEAVIVRVEIAGMSEGEFTILLEEQVLTVRGVRPDSGERRAYHQMEIAFGEFSTEVEIPYPINAQEIEAIYQDGFLRIVLPKARPYQVRIES